MTSFLIATFLSWSWLEVPYNRIRRPAGVVCGVYSNGTTWLWPRRSAGVIRGTYSNNTFVFTVLMGSTVTDAAVTFLIPLSFSRYRWEAPRHEAVTWCCLCRLLTGSRGTSAAPQHRHRRHQTVAIGRRRIVVADEIVYWNHETTAWGIS